MANTKPPLPEFADPPVIETVLGVEFPSIEGWAIPHFGLFWQQIRSEYPQFEVQPPLAVVDDLRSKEDRILQAVMIEFLPQPPVRCWYLDAGKTRLLQVQNDRFIHNWRKTEGGDAYLRYENIKPIFEREWKRFAEFLTAEKLGLPAPARCEVTYVNHFLKGKEWNSLADVSRIIPSWTGCASVESLSAPNALSINVRYPIMDEAGHLTIQVQPAIRQTDRKEILQMTLTAKGRPTSPDLDGVLAWLDLGRDSVVRAFCDFTSPEMHKLWGRKV